ncbi:MAG: DoxX family protein [Bacteroidales bacterium]|nr:DoxX family protein [Bacteroidales bacterium]
MIHTSQFKFSLKLVIVFFRIVIGAVFIFSGFVKGIDLQGSAIKFDDYFVAFGIDFLIPVSLPLAIFLVSTEFIIGISLLFGYRTYWGTWGVLIFMSAFTPLTLILALFNPVSDCGCFGDAIVLTNWQTFWKNVVLMIMVLVIFYNRKKFKPAYPAITDWSILVIIFVLFIGFSLYNYRHLPMIDFRPYNTGTNIPEKMYIPEDAPVDEYETILIYEKDGIKKEFDLENYPWQDSTWSFVEQKSILIKEGYKPPIHDFSIFTPDGNDITDIVLSEKSYSFILVSADLAKADKGALQKLDTLSLYCNQTGIKFYSLSSSIYSEIEQIKTSQQLSLDFYITDETTLKTIIRSNPGLLLLKEGIILAKWHYNDLPEIEDLRKSVLSMVITKARKKHERTSAIISFLVLFLGVSMFEVTRKFIFTHISQLP